MAQKWGALKAKGAGPCLGTEKCSADEGSVQVRVQGPWQADGEAVLVVVCASSSPG